MSQASGEHTSIDESSTIETISAETTLIINASKCFFCSKILGYQGRFSSCLKYHYACLESQVCVLCGSSGLLQLCSEKGCRNAFHLFCLQRSYPPSRFDQLKCSDHCENKKERTADYVTSFKKIANTIQTDEKRIENYKNLKGEIKANCFSHGQIFWAIIGTQYFPTTAKIRIPCFYLRKKNKKNVINKTWVSCQIKKLSKDFKSTKKANKSIFLSILPKKTEENMRNKEESSVISEKDLLIAESRSLRFRKFQKKFLMFCEMKKIQEIAIFENSVPCGICLENDDEDDDLIIPCKICGINIHMQCYGVSSDANDWVCLSCQSLSVHKSLCPLCPVTTGVFKPTINSSESKMQTHNNLPVGTQIWVHVFCALNIENSCIRDKSKIENIDIKSIDKKKFSETCEICNTKNGACIKCNVSKCKKFFHPECAKSNFLYTRNKTGSEDVSCYCNAHKPSKLRKAIEIKEKKIRAEFAEFIKDYEKVGKECLKRVSSDVSLSEKFQIFEFFDNFLQSRNGEFDIEIKWQSFDKALRRCVADSSKLVTFVEPEAFGNEEINTERLNCDEFQDFYEKNIIGILKKELKIMKIPLIGYKGQKTKLVSNDSVQFLII